MRWFALLSVVCAVACGSKSSSDEGTTGGTGDGTSDSAEADATDGTDDSNSETSAGTFCGIMECAPDQWCDWPANVCGPGDSGECVTKPQGCDANYDPVCGCDGQVYGNECEAQAAGVDIDNNNSCESMDDSFKCGPKWCPSETHYCRFEVSDVGGFPDLYQCRQLPEGCAACDCLADEPCGEFCEVGTPGITLTCPGG